MTYIIPLLFKKKSFNIYRENNMNIKNSKKPKLGRYRRLFSPTKNRHWTVVIKGLAKIASDN